MESGFDSKVPKKMISPTIATYSSIKLGLVNGINAKNSPIIMILNDIKNLLPSKSSKIPKINAANIFGIVAI